MKYKQAEFWNLNFKYKFTFQVIALLSCLKAAFFKAQDLFLSFCKKHLCLEPSSDVSMICITLAQLCRVLSTSHQVGGLIWCSMCPYLHDWEGPSKVSLCLCEKYKSLNSFALVFLHLLKALWITSRFLDHSIMGKVPFLGVARVRTSQWHLLEVRWWLIWGSPCCLHEDGGGGKAFTVFFQSVSPLPSTE